MQIHIKTNKEIPKEPAHGGSGHRKLYIDDKQSPSERIQGLTHGWLPAGNVFDWHLHDGIEEVMYVISGEGTVSDRDGDYPYAPGDVCVFPANVEHKITNNTDKEHQFIFMRIYV